MTSDAQTEARAIARLEYVHGSDGYALRPDAGGRYVLYTDHVAALDAKDAELAAQLRATQDAWNERDGEKRLRLRTEAQRDEALKALERIEVRTRSVPSDTAGDDKRDKYHANSIARAH